MVGYWITPEHTLAELVGADQVAPQRLLICSSHACPVRANYSAGDFLEASFAKQRQRRGPDTRRVRERFILEAAGIDERAAASATTAASLPDKPRFNSLAYEFCRITLTYFTNSG
jgi:hypothetical protein